MRLSKLEPLLPFRWALCVAVLATMGGCGTDPDADPLPPTSDAVDSAHDDAGADSTTDARLDSTPDAGLDAEPDIRDTNDAETTEVTDSTDVGDVEDADVEVADSDGGEDAEVSDANDADADSQVDATDAEDVPLDGSTLGQPCATHCVCNDGQYCDGASGTCQLIVIGVTAFCCADFPDDCPQGASCQIDAPEGGESTCGAN